MTSKLMRKVLVPAVVMTTLVGVSWAFQPEPSRSGEGQPRQREGQPGGEGRRGPGGEARQASVEGGMKSMGRPLRQLRSQITDGAKKEENLQLINDMQRGAVAAKGAKLSEKLLKNAKDDAAKAEMSKNFRKRMLALTKSLLEVESLLMDDKFDDAKAELEKAIKMRDEGHEALGVKDED